jgi:hypothetical protein
MPGASDVAYGNEKMAMVVYLSGVTFPTLGANASSSTTVTLPGVLPLDCIGWNMQAPPAHLVIDNIYVSSANTLTILWGTDGTGVTGASNLNVLFTVERATNANLGTGSLPGAIV